MRFICIMFEKWLLKVLLVCALLVYARGWFLPVMDVDSAQYASISAEMARTNQFLEVKSRNQDYLDKPPLLFWVSAVGFKIFGTTEFAFRFLPFLFLLAGFYAVYRLGILLYSKAVAFWAVVFFSTAQAIFLFAHDLRTDTLLTACLCLAIWQLAEYRKSNSWPSFIWGFVFLGLAMLAKGPLGLMIPVLAFGAEALLNRQWGFIFKWQWLLGLLVVLLVLWPMLWGLYHQFDLQPNKTVMMPTPDGLQPRTGISGLRFYFWEQSFGRLTGENDWKDQSGPFFFVHTLLWAFLPFSLLALAALLWKTRFEFSSWFKGHQADFLALMGFVLPFIAMSKSQYKLPHYIFPLLPLLSLITAQFVVERGLKYRLFLRYSSLFLVLILHALMFVLVFAFFPGNVLWYFFPGMTLLISFAIYYFQKDLKAWLLPLVFSGIACNLLLNYRFYPQLMAYQNGSMLGEKALNLGANESNTAYYQEFCFSFDFTLNGNPPVISFPEHFSSATKFIYTNSAGYRDLLEKGFQFKEVVEMPSFQVTGLSLDFLMASKRTSQLKSYYLLILP